MDLEVIWAALRRQPFRKFELTMNDGRSFAIEHPELLYVKNGSVKVVFPKEGVAVDLEPMLIASVLQWTEAEGESPSQPSPPAGEG
jgi:hypothetical protein